MSYSHLKQSKKFKPHSRAVLLDYNDLLSPLADYFKPAVLTDVVMKKDDNKPDVVLMWNDILPDYQMICKASAVHGIPTFVVQHGRGAARDYHLGSSPVATGIFVWGTNDETLALSGGWKREQVYRVGFPGFVQRPPKAEEKGTVVFDAVHWDDVIDENVEAWNALRKIGPIKPIAKLLRAQGPNHDPSRFPGLNLMTDQIEPGHLRKTYELISKASAVVCLIEGTLELLAYSLDVPVIHLNTLKPRQLLGRDQDEDGYKPSKGAEPATLETLEAKVLEALEHPEKRRKERREVLLEEGGDPETDTPYSSIVRIINSIVKARA
jgi:hypothetical protein